MSGKGEDVAIDTVNLEMKNRRRETKAGATPAANAFFDPERGYGTTDQKEEIGSREKSE